MSSDVGVGVVTQVLTNVHEVATTRSAPSAPSVSTRPTSPDSARVRRFTIGGALRAKPVDPLVMKDEVALNVAAVPATTTNDSNINDTTMPKAGIKREVPALSVTKPDSPEPVRENCTKKLKKDEPSRSPSPASSPLSSETISIDDDAMDEKSPSLFSISATASPKSGHLTPERPVYLPSETIAPGSNPFNIVVTPESLDSKDVSDLPPGWSTVLKTRRNGPHAVRKYPYFVSPDGKCYRSKKQVYQLLGVPKDMLVDAIIKLEKASGGKISKGLRKELKEYEKKKKKDSGAPAENQRLLRSRKPEECEFAELHAYLPNSKCKIGVGDKYQAVLPEVQKEYTPGFGGGELVWDPDVLETSTVESFVDSVRSSLTKEMQLHPEHFKQLLEPTLYTSWSFNEEKAYEMLHENNYQVAPTLEKIDAIITSEHFNPDIPLNNLVQLVKIDPDIIDRNNSPTVEDETCFYCEKEGILIICDSKCKRVFHKTCLRQNPPEDFLCPVCCSRKIISKYWPPFAYYPEIQSELKQITLSGAAHGIIREHARQIDSPPQNRFLAMKKRKQKLKNQNQNQVVFHHSPLEQFVGAKKLKEEEKKPKSRAKTKSKQQLPKLKSAPLLSTNQNQNNNNNNSNGNSSSNSNNNMNNTNQTVPTLPSISELSSGIPAAMAVPTSQLVDLLSARIANMQRMKDELLAQNKMYATENEVAAVLNILQPAQIPSFTELAMMEAQKQFLLNYFEQMQSKAQAMRQFQPLAPKPTNDPNTNTLNTLAGMNLPLLPQANALVPNPFLLFQLAAKPQATPPSPQSSPSKQRTVFQSQSPITIL